MIAFRAFAILIAWTSFWVIFPSLQLPFLALLGIKWFIIPAARESVPPVMEKDELYS